MSEHKFYIRSNEGETFYVDSLEEALTHLVSDKGYRLTVSDSQGNELIIRASLFERDHPDLPQVTAQSVTTVRLVNGDGES